MEEILKREPIESRSFTFDCRREFAERIVKAANARRLTYSELIRLALRELLERGEGKGVIGGDKMPEYPNAWR